MTLRRKESGYLMRTTFGRSFVDEFSYLWELLEKAPSAQVNLSRHFTHARWLNGSIEGSTLPGAKDILAEIDLATPQQKAR